MQKLSVGNGEEELNVEGLYEMFITSKKSAGVSPYTLDYYERCFISFKKYFDTTQPCSAINLKVIEGYILNMKDNPKITDISINSNLRGVRVFVYYGIESEYISPFKIHLIRAEKKIKETYTENELVLLLKKPNKKNCSFAEYRNWVIINYLLATGNRLETLVNIKNGDINFSEYEISLLKTKNKTQYIIPMSLELTKILREYLLYRKGTDDDYLFCSSYGKKLDKRTLQDQIKQYNKTRGVLKTSIHAFRHTFAKHWVLNGGDMFSLQNLLGHSSLEMVKEYVEMFSNDIKIGFNMHNPLDIIMKKNSKGDWIKMK